MVSAPSLVQENAHVTVKNGYAKHKRTWWTFSELLDNYFFNILIILHQVLISINKLQNHHLANPYYVGGSWLDVRLCSLSLSWPNLSATSALKHWLGIALSACETECWVVICYTNLIVSYTAHDHGVIWGLFLCLEWGTLYNTTQLISWYNRISHDPQCLW